jgi:hypothetical protein
MAQTIVKSTILGMAQALGGAWFASPGSACADALAVMPCQSSRPSKGLPCTGIKPEPSETNRYYAGFMINDVLLAAARPCGGVQIKLLRMRNNFA